MLRRSEAILSSRGERALGWPLRARKLTARRSRSRRSPLTGRRWA